VSYRAVVFDLYQTLIPYDAAIAQRGYRRLAAAVGVPDERFIALWSGGRSVRDTGPLREYISELVAELGLDDSVGETLIELRRGTARALLDVNGTVLAILDQLRARRKRLGVVSVCAEDVVDVWNETPLGSRFDATSFSCVLGVAKPDPAIYLHVCQRLDVPPSGCLYVGDGANDELRGAEAVGMTAVQLLVPDGEPDWGGAKIESLDEVLELA
jgi:putative hydrolase of the HAD superfamily